MLGVLQSDNFILFIDFKWILNGYATQITATQLWAYYSPINNITFFFTY